MMLRDVWPVPTPAGFARAGFALGIIASCLSAVAAEPGSSPRIPTGPTFTKDVAPILQKRCQSCHRAGQIGPFVLETYEQTRKRAKDVMSVVETGSMPPWKPTAGFGPKLKHDPSLTAAEVALLKAWVAAGAPKGDDAAMPPPVRYTDGWSLGTPDLILETAEDYTVTAAGPDIYRCFVVPTKLTKDVYVTAVEYRPGNRRVVHHMQAYIDTEGGGREMDEADPGPGYTSFSGAGVDIAGDMGGWTPGSEPTRLPSGIGRFLPMRSDIILQIHYHPSGKAETDRTKIGVYFSREPVEKTLHWANASSYDFKLPAGNPRVEVKATWYVPVDVDALAVTPHMHQLGRDFKISVRYPDGRTRDLLQIDDWNPSWQNTYYFESPVSLPKGSTVNVIAHFDNSSHARNPHKPPKLIRWGHEASAEMCTGYIGVVKKGQDLTRAGEKDDLFEIFTRQLLKNAFRDQARQQQRKAERANAR